MAKRKLSSEINVVPYIDVMLVLLIIFMVTAPLMVQGIEVDLPDTNAQSLTSQEEDAKFSVTAKGEFMFNKAEGKSSQPLTDEEVVEAVAKLVQANPTKLIMVEGDQAVAYERIAHGMSLLQSAGARKIGFITQPLDDTTAP
ncbi:MAG: protein TolR [Pseudomonadota bacterium]|nr:protein TolR [Pseudomonadota bacterium]